MGGDVQLGSFAAKWMIWSNMDRCLHTCGAAVNCIGRGKMDGWPPLRDRTSCPKCWGGTRGRGRERGKVSALSGGRRFPETPVDGFLPQRVEWRSLQCWRTAWSLSGLGPATAQKGAQVNGSWMLINWGNFLLFCSMPWRFRRLRCSAAIRGNVEGFFFLSECVRYAKLKGSLCITNIWLITSAQIP